jgi:hypothetical protein
MRPSSIRQAALVIFKETSVICIYLEGAPGGGKTTVAKQVGIDLGIPRENIHVFRASLRDPVDLLGTPRNDEGLTRWLPPAELAVLRTGRHLLIVDELSDCEKMMQNGLCGLINDREVGELQLSPEVYIIATGNRTKDKSGANRIVTKLGNRVLRLEYTENFDDWKDWAFNEGQIKSEVISYLNFAQKNFAAFDPDVFSCPTPRQWEKVSRIPSSLPADVYLEAISGLVGAGAAAEFCAFARLSNEMPDPDACIANPTKAPTVKAKDVQYALLGAIGMRATEDNLANCVTYAGNYEPDMQVTMMYDISRRAPALKKTRAFVQWAVKYSDLMI